MLEVDLHRRSLWQMFLAGISVLAACTGCSLRQNPLPELREVGDELQRSIPPTHA